MECIHGIYSSIDHEPLCMEDTERREPGDRKHIKGASAAQRGSGGCERH